MRLDANQRFPSGMKEYLSYYGWHFSKKMCEWASNNMYKETNSRKEYIQPYTKEEINKILNDYGIDYTSYIGYDYVYIANMCKADFYGSSIHSEADLALYIKDVIEDKDAYEGMPFTRFYADCIGKGIPINWEDMI